MMLPDPAPISTRELVWHLPELLEGSEPVLERPQVVQYLKTNAEARATLLAVAEVARTVIAGSERRPRLPRRTIVQMSRPVETAIRYFKVQMVELLFRVGLDQFERVTWELGMAYGSHALRSSPPPRGDLSAVPQRLMDSLGLTARSLGEQKDHVRTMATLLGEGTQEGLQHALDLMRACDVLFPGREVPRYYLIEIPSIGRPSNDVRTWLKYVSDATRSNTRAAGLSKAANILREQGEYGLAARASEQAVLHDPQTMLLQFHSALGGALIGDARMLEQRLSSWAEWVSRSEKYEEIGVRHIHDLGKYWRIGCAGLSRSMEELFEKTPARIRTAVSEVMS